jgi:hypothetical protein
MLRHMLMLAVFALGSLQAGAQAASFSGGSEGGAPLNLEQAHPGSGVRRHRRYRQYEYSGVDGRSRGGDLCGFLRYGHFPKR